jgi:hypothetical protein
VEALAALAAAAGLSFAVQALRELISRRTRPERGQTLDERLRVLVGSLNQASTSVGEIEREIRSRQELVDRLRREQRLLELNRDEVDAVAQALGGEVKREGRKTFWMGVAQNGVFFGLGVGVTLWVA